MQKIRWSVDFGNVLVQNIARTYRGRIMELYKAMRGENDTDALDTFLRTCSHTVPGALEGLKALTNACGAENVFIVSRAIGMERSVNRRLWDIHRFTECTGVPAKQVFFVDQYHEKESVCWSLGVNWHVDDRGAVHHHLLSTVEHLVWFSPSERDISRWSGELTGRVMQVAGWEDIVPLVQPPE